MRKQYKIFNRKTKELVLETSNKNDFGKYDSNEFGFFNQELNVIVACNKDGIIGVDGKIPWYHSEDLKFFKKTTMNSSLIMGRKTWESLKKPLVGRDVIIVSKKKLQFIYAFDKIANSLDQAIEISDPGQNIWIAGGGEIYDQVLRESDWYGVNKIFLTLVPNIVNISSSKNVAFFPLKLLENFEFKNEIKLNEKLIVKEFWNKNEF
jgi:dihydrofolate reductase